MKKIKITFDQKKLSLNKETIASMTSEQLNVIYGGSSGANFCTATHDMSKCPQCYDTYTCDPSVGC